MRHAQPTSTRRSLQQQAWQSDAIEWEELPSLADSLHQRLVVLGERHRGADAADSGYDWERTQVSELDALPPSEPFREALEGLVMREVIEPDVFRHFFGATAAA